MNRDLDLLGRLRAAAARASAAGPLRSGLSRAHDAAEAGGPLVWGALVLLAAYPLLLNRFPIVFPDTAGYVTWIPGPVEPIYYQLFAWLLSRTASIYLIALLQAAAAVYLIALFFRCVTGSRSVVGLAASTAAVLLLTQLPWLASWIMPDVFAGLGASGLVLLLWFRAGLSLREQVSLGAIVVFCAVVATANVLVYLGLGAACLAGRRLLSRRERDPGAWGVAALLALSMWGLSVAPNLAHYGRASISTTGSVRLFSRLVDARLAQKYLRLHCPSEPILLCRRLPELEAYRTPEAFLWRGLPDLNRAWTDPSGAYGRLAHAIVAAYPAQTAALYLHDAGRLFLSPTLSPDDLAHHRPGDRLHDAFAAVLPSALADLDAARQQRGELSALFPARLYAAGAYLSYALALALVLVAAARRDRRTAALGLAFFVLLALDLAVHALVGPYARYQVKVSWVAWMVVIAGVQRLAGAGRDLRPVTSQAAAQQAA